MLVPKKIAAKDALANDGLQNSPAVKKVRAPQESYCEKDVKYKVVAKK